MKPESQFNLFEAAPAYRRTDPETSRQAAQDAATKCTANQLRALRLIAQGAKTDYDLERITGLQKNSIGKRRSDLYRAGLVEPATDCGQTVKRPGPSGSRCIVWRITARGTRYLTSLKHEA